MKENTVTISKDMLENINCMLKEFGDIAFKSGKYEESEINYIFEIVDEIETFLK